MFENLLNMIWVLLGKPIFVFIFILLNQIIFFPCLYLTRIIYIHAFYWVSERTQQDVLTRSRYIGLAKPDEILRSEIDLFSWTSKSSLSHHADYMKLLIGSADSETILFCLNSNCLFFSSEVLATSHFWSSQANLKLQVCLLLFRPQISKWKYKFYF